MTTRRRRAPVQKTFRSGPWTRVMNTTDPLDDPPDILVDASNIYIPDPGGSGAYSRPGFSAALNGSNPRAIEGPSTAWTGQGIISHVGLDGTKQNFLIYNGKMFRANAALTAFTNVTPVGVAIQSGRNVRVYGTGLATFLVITDGVNRPWLATNLTATPITGTYIDFDGIGTAWTAFGPAVVYGGSVFFILNTVGGVAARSDIAWSLPGTPATGYQQPNYDFRWTLFQSADGSAPPALYALAAANTQLFYFRAGAIGSLSGTPGPSLSGAATHDAISVNVGTTAPQCVVQYGRTIFFVDANGRPYRLQQGSGEPEAIWLQMRAVVETPTLSPGQWTTVSAVATAAYDSSMNVYIVAPWSYDVGDTGPPTVAYVFDAASGRYFGKMSVFNGVQVDSLGTVISSDGRSVLAFQGSATPPVDAATLANSGYFWMLTSLDVATGANWLDIGGLNAGQSQSVACSVTTGRLGYDIDTVLNVDRVSALVGNDYSCAIQATTSSVPTNTQGTPSPPTVQDDIGRVTVGCAGVQGRGVTITVSSGTPPLVFTQWSIQQVSVNAVVSLSTPNEA